MAKKRLKIKDKQGNIVDYDISAASVTIDIEGKSLDVKLSEIAAALLQSVTEVTFNGTAHNRENGKINLGNQMQPDWSESSQTYPSYIRNKPNVVTGIKVGMSGQTYTPTSGVVVLPESEGTVECDNSMSSTSENPVQNKVIKAYVDNLIAGLVNGAPAALDTLKELADALGDNDDAIATLTNALAGKVDKVTGKGLSTNDYTDADNALVATIPSKANDNEVVKSISVNGGEAQTPMQGNVNIVVQGADGITPHIGSNGNWFIGDTDTTIHAQGPAGTSYTSADLVIGNALNGQGDVLGMSGAMRIKSNIDAVQANLVKLYNKLANMAFWDATDQAAAEPIPTLLDWSVPKKTLTVVNSITNSIVMYDGAPVTSPIQVDMGTTVNLLVVGDTGYGISSVDNITGATIVNNGDGTFTVSVTVDDTMTVTITGTTIALNAITYALTGLSASGPSGVATGANATIVLTAQTGYALPFSVQVSGATSFNYTRSTGTIEIINATGAVTITAEGIYNDYTFLPSKMASYMGWFSNNGTRGTVVIDRSKVSEPNTWVSHDGNDYTDGMSLYSMIPIPDGATTAKLMVGSGFGIYSFLLTNNGSADYDQGSWNDSPASPISIDLTQYPTSKWLIANIRKGNNQQFNGETMQDIGFSLEFL